MVISCCSFGSSGSSAVSDYLKEFECNQVLDSREFTWLNSPDGLIDLEHHLMHPHGRTSDSIYSIHRFLELAKNNSKGYSVLMGIDESAFVRLAEEFIENIVQVKWKWYPSYPERKGTFIDYIKSAVFVRRLIPKYERKTGKIYNGYPLEDVYFASIPQNFYIEAKKYVSKLLQAAGADFTKNVVLDQAFSGEDPAAAFPYFDEARAIVVDRDPRDQYVFAKTQLHGRNHFMPCENVEDFVTYYRALRDGHPYQTPAKNILKIQFEDMIYRYDETTEQIRCFCNLPENPAARSIFDPNLSVNNTQVFKRFPQYENDVTYISEHLYEYLYDYSRFPEIDLSGKMFHGKSPLNKPTIRKR